MFVNAIHKLADLYYRLFYKISSNFCKIVFVISDSHSSINSAILTRIKNLPRTSAIHCGDWSAIEDYHELKGLFSDLYGVCGNTETNEIEKKLPERLEFEINGFKIIVIHEIDSYKRYVEKSEKPGKILVLHGHTHHPSKKKIKKTYFFNPGSCGPKRFSNVPPSYGVVYFFKRHFIMSLHKIWFRE